MTTPCSSHISLDMHKNTCKKTHVVKIGTELEEFMVLVALNILAIDACMCGCFSISSLPLTP